MISDDEDEFMVKQEPKVPSKKRKRSAPDLPRKKRKSKKDNPPNRDKERFEFCHLSDREVDFLVVFPSAVELKKVFQSLKEFNDYCRWEITDTGLHLDMLDSSHVAYFQVQYQPEHFLWYEPGADTRLNQLSIRTSTFFTVVNNGRKGDHVAVYRKKSDPHIVIEYGNCECTIPELNVDAENLDITPLDYDAEIAMPSEELRGLMRDLKSLKHDVVEIKAIRVPFETAETKVGCAIFACKSDDHGSYEYLHHDPFWETVQQQADQLTQAKLIKKMKKDAKRVLFSTHYSVKYLEKFMNVCSLADVTVFKLKEDTPLLVENIFGEGNCRIAMYVGPKIVNF